MSATIINLIIQLIAGAIGGNAAGAASKNISSGTLGNTIAGAIGGVGGGQLLSALIPMMAGVGNTQGDWPFFGSCVAQTMPRSQCQT